MSKKRVVIVGGGFAGMACAHRLTKDSSAVHVTLIDRNNYNQFKPLLYQVATSQLSTEEVACNFREFFSGKANIDIKREDIVSIDPKTLTVKTKEGTAYQGDYLVLSTGSVVNFFNTPGAESNSFPLYTLKDAERLRSRILIALEDADRDPSLVSQGALNFIIVGAGPTGTEIAGALADMFQTVIPKEFKDLDFEKAEIHLVDHGKAVLGPFSKKSQEYAAKVLQKRGVKLNLGTLVKEVGSDHVLLSDGSKILSRTIIWAGGLQAAPMAAHSGLPQGHGGRINVLPNLSVDSFSSIFVLGDLANILNTEGKSLPQLASVAQQSGRAAAQNILNDLAGKPRDPFHYIDKGIMAMIGKDAAVVEIGEKRHQFEGAIAFATWLGVHTALLYTFRQKIEALMEWTSDYLGNKRPTQVIDRDE